MSANEPVYVVGEDDVHAHESQSARKSVPRHLADSINHNRHSNGNNDATNVGVEAPVPQSRVLPAPVPAPAITERIQPTPSATEEVSQPPSPGKTPRPPASDEGSLDVRFERSSLNDPRYGKLSTQTQKSASISHKRNNGEMEGTDPASQPDARPVKQPFSPSSSRDHQQTRIDTSHFNKDRPPAEMMSPVTTTTTSPGILKHYHNLSTGIPDLQKEPPIAFTTSSSTAAASSENVLVKQPATRPITEQQLINEVKGIYAGLVMVEKKCVEIVAQQSQSTKRLSDQQWKALVALHRTLLQEHHDFFSASQHPTASETLKRLAIKYAMPARMWRHGIHAFLELLRHRLPDSMEHMLSFIYLSYSMMALLKESVPSFVETWIECLGDLARYRMAIEDTDPRDRENWSNVAKMWYNEAADKSPNVGRIQHHLAVLARPHITEQLFYYDKALVSVVPFVNARESIMLLFDMFLKNSDAVQTRYNLTEYAFVNTYSRLFTRQDPQECVRMLEMFKTHFGGHMDRTGARFKLQGAQMASSLFAGLLDFGKEDAHLWRLFCRQMEESDTRKTNAEGKTEKPAVQEVQQPQMARQVYWSSMTFTTHVDRIPPPQNLHGRTSLENSEDVATAAASLAFQAISLVASRMGDKNGVPFMHVVLAILWNMSVVPGALVWIEACIPWTAIILFLNTLGRSGVSYASIEADKFPPSHGGHGRQLPEDFLMRGLMLTRLYYESDFFAGPLVDEDERTIELPSHQAPRAERCLWLGVRLASLGRYFTYDLESKMFETTEFARSLATSYV